jgi:hypothetical protein
MHRDSSRRIPSQCLAQQALLLLAHAQDSRSNQVPTTHCTITPTSPKDCHHRKQPILQGRFIVTLHLLYINQALICTPSSRQNQLLKIHKSSSSSSSTASWSMNSMNSQNKINISKTATITTIKNKRNHYKATSSMIPSSKQKSRGIG